jgi:hypothetical protein
MLRQTVVLSAALLLGLATGSASAADPINLEIKDQAFVTPEINVPAGVKVLLLVKNDDDLPAEFESTDLGREIVVPAHSQVKVYIGPLDPGRYRFFNDFHQASQGWVTVAAAGK